ncbi:MAG: MerR family transcriptional regulator [Candidatus Methylomirabilia bacterium]
MAQEIPDKLYYRIGEVEALTGLPPYVLRYWESEFKLLKPKKSDTGQRLYTKRELELVARIKTLLYEERLTLEGAKKRLLTESRKRSEQLDLGVPETVYEEVLKRVRRRLLALRSLLRGEEPPGEP